MKTEKGETFPSILVVGAAGQTGGLYIENFAQTGLSVNGVIKDKHLERLPRFLSGRIVLTDLREALLDRPKAVLVATPNPVGDILRTIRDTAETPLTVILPQNGVAASHDAIDVFRDSKQIEIVRASLFTVVDQIDGTLIYNPDKRRIVLAPVPTNGQFPTGEEQGLQQTRALFESAGFDVAIMQDHNAQQWVKLETNLLGAIGAITGLGPKETLRDFFLLEIRAAMKRRTLLRAAGIPGADIPWLKPLELLLKMPEPLLLLGRHYIAEKFAKERNNRLQAPARQIADGKSPDEMIEYYLGPFRKLAREQGVQIPVDDAMYRILSWNKDGKIDLRSMEVAKRRALFLEVLRFDSQESFTPRNHFVTAVAEKGTKLITNKLTILGQESIAPIVEALKNKESVLLAPNHDSHLNHQQLISALQKTMGKEFDYEKLLMVAGMLVGKELVGRIFINTYNRVNIGTLYETSTPEDILVANLLNPKSLRVATQMLKDPHLLVEYFEGTRSRTGRLRQSASRGASIYLKHNNIKLVVPIAIIGADKMLPPGKLVPRKGEVTIVFGKPIETARLIEEAAHMSREERDSYISNAILDAINDLLPEDKKREVKASDGESLEFLASS